MKTLLTLALCLCACLSLRADEGPPPLPTGDKGRFTVVSGMVDHGGGPVPTFIRMDTFTGQTWIYQQVPIPGANGALVNVWVPTHEVGSNLYGSVSKAMHKK